VSDWRDGYDDWKLRSPDWDDDPCAEVRHELGREIDELERELATVKGLLKTVLTETFPNPVEFSMWQAEAYEALGIPDPSKPVEEEIAF
jgi:hypothetical protein